MEERAEDPMPSVKVEPGTRPLARGDTLSTSDVEIVSVKPTTSQGGVFTLQTMAQGQMPMRHTAAGMTSKSTSKTEDAAADLAQTGIAALAEVDRIALELQSLPTTPSPPTLVAMPAPATVGGTSGGLLLLPALAAADALATVGRTLESSSPPLAPATVGRTLESSSPLLAPAAVGGALEGSPPPLAPAAVGGALEGSSPPLAPAAVFATVNTNAHNFLGSQAGNSKADPWDMSSLEELICNPGQYSQKVLGISKLLHARSLTLTRRNSKLTLNLKTPSRLSDMDCNTFGLHNSALVIAIGYCSSGIVLLARDEKDNFKLVDATNLKQTLHPAHAWPEDLVDEDKRVMALLEQLNLIALSIGKVKDDANGPKVETSKDKGKRNKPKKDKPARSDSKKRDRTGVMGGQDNEDYPEGSPFLAPEGDKKSRSARNMRPAPDVQLLAPAKPKAPKKKKKQVKKESKDVKLEPAVKGATAAEEPTESSGEETAANGLRQPQLSPDSQIAKLRSMLAAPPRPAALTKKQEIAKLKQEEIAMLKQQLAEKVATEKGRSAQAGRSDDMSKQLERERQQDKNDSDRRRRDAEQAMREKAEAEDKLNGRTTLYKDFRSSDEFDGWTSREVQQREKSAAQEREYDRGHRQREYDRERGQPEQEKMNQRRLEADNMERQRQRQHRQREDGVERDRQRRQQEDQARDRDRDRGDALEVEWKRYFEREQARDEQRDGDRNYDRDYDGDRRQSRGAPSNKRY